MDSQPIGVNLVGYFRSENGLGQVARGLAASLDAAGVPHTDFMVDGPHRAEHGYELREGPMRPVSLVVVNADMCGATLAALPAELSRSRTIGMWAWEVDAAPESFGAAVAHVDEVWSYSRFGLPALARSVECPVRVAPVPVIAEESSPHHQAATTTKRPLFLFCFDYTSVFGRKNPLAVIEAFVRAFPGPGEAELLVKSVNAARFPSDHAALIAAAHGRDDVRIEDGYLARADQHALFEACDAYVSLHRAEGFGLTIAEAMLLGKPVVVTAYSGNLDFTTAQNSYLVPWSPITIGPSHPPYPSDAVWAEPDVEVAASHMRSIVHDPDVAAERALRGRLTIERNHSATAVGDALARMISDAHRGSVGRRRDMVAATQSSPVAPRAASDDATISVALRVALRVRRFLGVDNSEAELTAYVNRAAGDLRSEQAGLASAFHDLMARVDSSPYTSAPAPLSFDENDPPIEFWTAFSDQYRGSEAFIRSRMAHYVERLSECQPVVDLGCGRGELLELLAERGVPAVGVDANGSQVAGLRLRGYDVVEADALDYLEDVPPASLGSVFSAQMVEHTTFSKVDALLKAAKAALRPGGLLVIETVNPLSIAGLKTFWLDPTHEKPIYAETLLLAARAVGYASGHIEFPFGSGDWERDRATAGEYALVARTPSR